MVTALLTHPDCWQHINPPGHAEQVARLDAVMAALEGMDLARLDAPFAAEADILRAHPKRYLDSLRRAEPEEGWRRLDPDTQLSPGSLGAAFRAAGAAVKAVELVLSGAADNAFVATRPPGHHAERETAMGFCLLSNAAIAAKAALDHHGLSRVAVLDFDVHHGNGTEDCVKDDPRILFCSSHQMPLYPGTGDPAETGPHDTIVNVALAEGTTGAEIIRIWERQILPRVRAFSPELIILSAGFDAHEDDPLAGLAMQTADYARLTGLLTGAAQELCGGKLVSLLEGGYDLAALGASVRAHVETLKERA
ncbi:histone deacetylase family protein [Pseudoroseicyclus sp. CXY001]|uniref:histone deacetylase family protein n=1 Tax=Pseudoroseicyclus sp. CXY001 TaxID=3242492 RepID=UPI0035717233